MAIGKVGLKTNERLPKVLFYKQPTKSIMHPPQTEYVRQPDLRKVVIVQIVGKF